MTTLRGGFDRGLGGSSEATAGAQYAALAQAAMELARSWAQAAQFVEPDPENYPSRFSSYHYSIVSEEHSDDAAASAAAAAASAAAAAASAAAAAASATAAAASATAAETHYNDLRTLYLGAQPSDPNIDPLGNPVDVGDFYFNTTSGAVKYWDGATWVTDTGAAGAEFYYQSSPPTASAPGAEWVDSDTGILYTWVDDGVTQQWVEF